MPRAAAFLGLVLLTGSIAFVGGACSSAELVDNRIAQGGGDASPTGDDDGGGDDAATSGDARVTKADGGSTVGAPPPSTTAATVIVEPSDNATAILNAIKAAKKSVHMTMYLLSSTSMVSALIAQKNAGHEVKVILNQNFPDPGSSNQSVYNQLQSAGVAVTWAPSAFQFTHAKCVIIDATTAWVMTMNLTYSSPTDNREYLAIDTDSGDVSNLEGIFADDFANHSHVTTGNVLVAPLNASDRVNALINYATSTLDVEVEELSDDGVTQSLANAQDRGVKVRIVLSDVAPTPAQQTSIATLKQHHVSLVTLSKPYVHAKAIVADGKLAYVGSANFTTNSLKYNRELGLVLAAQPEVAKVGNTIAADFGNGKAL